MLADRRLQRHGAVARGEGDETRRPQDRAERRHAGVCGAGRKQHLLGGGGTRGGGGWLRQRCECGGDGLARGRAGVHECGVVVRECDAWPVN